MNVFFDRRWAITSTILWALFGVVTLAALCSTGCQQTPPPETPPPFQTFDLQSDVLAESRTINVYLPPDYSREQPVKKIVYMLDGAIHEDFPHIANTLDRLIRNKKIEPVLLVGIANTDRKRDLTFETTSAQDREIAPTCGGADRFRKFIGDELQPEISRRYQAAESTVVIGESLAGLFIVDCFVKSPQMFDGYIAIDPSLWWSERALLTVAREKLPDFTAERPKRVWLAASNTSDIMPHVTELDTILKQRKPENLNWSFLPQPEEQHHTIFRAVKERAFLDLLGFPGEGSKQLPPSGNP